MKIKNEFFVLLFVILIFQFSFLGFKYYTVLDDNNQIGCYNLRNENIYENVISHYKSYNVRPLAFFSDAYIFQLFWNNLYILLFIIVVMHALNMFFLYKIADKIKIKLNAFAIVLFAFCPIIFDGLYWISASTRIVFSLFLCLASIYLVTLSFDKKEKWEKYLCLVFGVILNLACVGYYEQTVALNLFLFTFVLICLKKYKYISIPVVSTAWIGVWYIYFMLKGDMQERGTLNLSSVLNSLVASFKSFFSNVTYIIKNFKNYFSDGANIIFMSIISVVFLALIGLFLYYIFRKKALLSDENGKARIRKAILGIIIFISPILPFAVIRDNYMALRTMYMPMLGVLILIEVIVDLVLQIIKQEKIRNIAKFVFVGSICMSSIIANIGLLNNYKKVSDVDTMVIGELIDYIDDESFYINGKSISLNYNLDDLTRIKGYNNYLASVLEANWATMGKIQVMINKFNVGEVFINSNEAEVDLCIFLDENLKIDKTK